MSSSSDQLSLERKMKHYRISASEYELICERLGRPPQGVEWALFSALWSEHCSYKSSKVHLKKFFSQSERVVEGFGENAGVIDLGQGERVAFKMESHNHPSFIEPYQGAATGVGGILRDIFTMGARPIALADYLCFGQTEAPRMVSLVDGVVRGIGGYGNCVGVPTVSGQTEFHSSYNGNILVNAFALGLFRPGEKVFISKAKGVGNLVVYVGAKTGRDGVHGASMASESFGADSASKRPTVQIGDPFFEKLLIESCLEVMSKDLVVAIQDMGAAGLTSSSFEMASKGGVGLDLDLDKVPLRDASITPEEILLSESQERMLLICTPEKLNELVGVIEKWGLDAAVIGKVCQERRVRLKWHGEEIVNIDPDLLVENAPQYQRPYSPWKSRATSQLKWEGQAPGTMEVLQQMLMDARFGSREWIYRQYDQRVGARTIADCEDSVAALRLKDSGRDLGVVLGCRPYMMRLDASEGGKDSVAYPALELAAKGFEPLAVTDCLNFGNPENPEVMSEFVAAVEGLNDVCVALNTPVISGNVSLYNETQGQNITSTPSTGLVGLRSGNSNVKSQFRREGDVIVMLSDDMLSTYGMWVEDHPAWPSGFSGAIIPERVGTFAKTLREIVNSTDVSASRVVGKGGLAYALTRLSLSGTGASVEIAGSESQESGFWFCETCYRVLLSVAASDLDKVLSLAKRNSHVKAVPIGKTGGDVLALGQEGRILVRDLLNGYRKGWEAHFAQLA